MSKTMRLQKRWFVVGGGRSVVWGVFHVVVLLPLAFDPMLLTKVVEVSDGVTLSDATGIVDLLTVVLVATLTVYVVPLFLGRRPEPTAAVPTPEKTAVA